MSDVQFMSFEGTSRDFTQHYINFLVEEVRLLPQEFYIFDADEQNAIFTSEEVMNASHAYLSRFPNGLQALGVRIQENTLFHYAPSAYAALMNYIQNGVTRGTTEPIAQDSIPVPKAKQKDKEDIVEEDNA